MYPNVIGCTLIVFRVGASHFVASATYSIGLWVRLHDGDSESIVTEIPQLYEEDERAPEADPRTNKFKPRQRIP